VWDEEVSASKRVENFIDDLNMRLIGCNARGGA